MSILDLQALDVPDVESFQEAGAKTTSLTTSTTTTTLWTITG